MKKSKQEILDDIRHEIVYRLDSNQKVIDEFKSVVSQGDNWAIVSALKWKQKDVCNAYTWVNEMTRFLKKFDENLDNIEVFADWVSELAGRYTAELIKGFYDTNDIIDSQKYLAQGRVVEICELILQELRKIGVDRKINLEHKLGFQLNKNNPDRLRLPGQMQPNRKFGRGWIRQSK